MTGAPMRSNPAKLAAVPSVDPIAILLDRLTNVRRCGRGYIARCPAHEDKTASLSVTAGDDGRVLMHCFAGCSAPDVVASIGLSVADLFVRKPTAQMSFRERHELRQRARESQWAAALNVLSLEARIALIAACDVRNGKVLEVEDLERIKLACNRITDAKEVLCGRGY